jgi:sec-independent protein translocase protein TatB
MFDIGWSEFFIVAVLALIVVGPKDLPKALRAVTKVMRKARGLAREFQSGVDEMVREAELDDIKKEMNAVRDFDPVDSVRKEVDPAGTLTEDFDPVKFNRDLMDRLENAKSAPGGGSTAAPDAPAKTSTETAAKTSAKTSTKTSAKAAAKAAAKTSAGASAGAGPDDAKPAGTSGG